MGADWLHRFLGVPGRRFPAPGRPITPVSPDVQQAACNLANNRTRRSRSLTRKLLREGNIHLLPLYYLFNLSDLGREGIENSGSYRFADHIYRNQASGRGLIGRWIDARMLASAPSQAFRPATYLRQCTRNAAQRWSRSPPRPGRCAILAIPCGLPRDVKGLAAELQKDNPALLQRIEYHGMDVDADLLRLAEEFTANVPLPVKQYHQGNALLAETFPPGPFHFVASTGLNEFLEEPQLEVFNRNVYDRLAPGGALYTSCTQKERRSEVAMLRCPRAPGDSLPHAGQELRSSSWGSCRGAESDP